MITVEKTNDTTCTVTVNKHTVTVHQVTIDPAYYAKLVQGRTISLEQLVQRSFEFLLQRESNTSILTTFNLSVISHYFPDYEAKIQTML